MLVLSIRLVNGFGQVKQLRSEGLSRPPIDWRLFVKQHARYLGIKKPVALYVSKLASSPLTVGFWKPIILIPVASINQLSPQQLEAVLLHELAHIRRHDYLLNIILQMAEIALFFNPFMRLLLKQARQERENSCDDWVLQFRYNAADYARALLTIEKQSTQSLLALGTNNKNEFQLLNRVKRMLAPERQSFNYRQQLGLLFLITLLGLGFTMIVPRQKAKHQQEVRETRIETASVQQSQAEAIAPVAVDLVKKLEDIQKINKVVASKAFQEKTGALAEAAVDMSEKLATTANLKVDQEEIDKHTRAIAKALETIPLKDFEFAGVDAAAGKNFQFQLSQMDQQWNTVLEPALTEGAKAWAMIPGLQNEPRTITLARGGWQPQNAEIAARKHKIKKDEKAEAEKQQIRLYRLSKSVQKIQDSIVIVQRDVERNGRNYAIAMEKAQKAMAIAPFKVEDMSQPKAATLVYNYNYNTGAGVNAGIDNEMNWQSEATSSPRVTRIYTKKKVNSNDNDNCTCDVASPKAHARTVVTINGRAIGEKVKTMIQNAQKELGDEWTVDLQMQIEQELKKDLKELEKLTIKTHVITGSGNNKAIVVEIDSNK
jgi:hypothetical protein